jgi:hypothetical protein
MIFDVIKKFGQQCKEEKGTKTEARLFLGAPHTATDAINSGPLARTSCKDVYGSGFSLLFGCILL